MIVDFAIHDKGDGNPHAHRFRQGRIPCGLLEATCRVRPLPGASAECGDVYKRQDQHPVKVCPSFDQAGLDRIAQTVLGGLVDHVEGLNMQ